MAGHGGTGAQTHAVLPTITPAVSFVMVAAAMTPGIVAHCRRRGAGGREGGGGVGGTRAGGTRAGGWGGDWGGAVGEGGGGGSGGGVAADGTGAAGLRTDRELEAARRAGTRARTRAAAAGAGTEGASGKNPPVSAAGGGSGAATPTISHDSLSADPAARRRQLESMLGPKLAAAAAATGGGAKELAQADADAEAVALHRDLLRLVAHATLCAFMFGWHVHEKATLMVTVPLAIALVGTDG